MKLPQILPRIFSTLCRDLVFFIACNVVRNGRWGKNIEPTVTISSSVKHHDEHDHENTKNQENGTDNDHQNNVLSVFLCRHCEIKIIMKMLIFHVSNLCPYNCICNQEKFKYLNGQFNILFRRSGNFIFYLNVFHYKIFSSRAKFIEGDDVPNIDIKYSKVWGSAYLHKTIKSVKQWNQILLTN